MWRAPNPRAAILSHSFTIRTANSKARLQMIDSAIRSRSTNLPPTRIRLEIGDSITRGADSARVGTADIELLASCCFLPLAPYPSRLPPYSLLLTPSRLPLPQERFRQSAVDGNDVPGRFRAVVT